MNCARVLTSRRLVLMISARTKRFSSSVKVILLFSITARLETTRPPVSRQLSCDGSKCRHLRRCYEVRCTLGVVGGVPRTDEAWACARAVVSRGWSKGPWDQAANERQMQNERRWSDGTSRRAPGSEGQRRSCQRTRVVMAWSFKGVESGRRVCLQMHRRREEKDVVDKEC